MPDPNPATPAATSAGFDSAAIAALVTTAIAAAIAPLNDRLAKFESAAATPATPAAAAAAATAKPLTMDDLEKAMDARLAAAQTTAQTQQQRNAHAADKLKDLPEIYREKLGNDPAKWAAEEAAIRGKFQADYAALGLKPADISGVPPATAAGAAPGALVNLDNNSAQANISAGLKSVPVTK